MDLYPQFKDFISRVCMVLPGDRILVAVSGGIDSMVMCQLFHQSGFSCGIAHCNFGLRGEESDEDERFVRQQAEKWDLEFFTIRFNTEEYARERKIAIQEAARDLRYNWFEQLRLSGGFRYTATAHHINDSIETLLINFFKGTGIMGLHGILPRTDPLIRPMLFASREQILEYSQSEHISFREDSSNHSLKYTRNKIRLQLIPAIEAVFPEARQQLTANIRRFAEAGELYHQMIAWYRKDLLEKSGEEWKIPVVKLARCRPLLTIVYELMRSFDFNAAQTGEILKLLESGSGKSVSSSTHTVLRDRKWLIISPVANLTPSYFMIHEGDRTLAVPDNTFTLEWGKLRKFDLQKDILTAPSDTAFIDPARIEFPMLLRRWRIGDYFYPLGMHSKKKKVSRLFIDKKLPLHEKGKTWILTSGSKIVWVAGIQMDERFKVSSSTTNILKIRLR
jgi:tRNA(Ile)-lysidine synthase